MIITNVTTPLIHLIDNLCSILHPFSLLFTVSLLCSSPTYTFLYRSLPPLLLLLQLAFNLVSAPENFYYKGYAAAALIYIMAWLYARSRLALVASQDRASQASWIYTRVPSLVTGGVVNVSYFCAPLLSCIVENYSGVGDEQRLCEDVLISSEPVTILVAGFVFLAALELAPSPRGPYSRDAFHRWDIDLSHQIIVALFFGTALIACWTYASMRQLNSTEDYQDWDDDKGWGGRNARWWYSIGETE